VFSLFILSHELSTASVTSAEFALHFAESSLASGESPGMRNGTKHGSKACPRCDRQRTCLGGTYRIASIFLVVFNVLVLFPAVVFLFLVVIFLIRLFSKQGVGA